ncbi:type 4 pilus major pilin [Allopusillimonas soli]|nr:type 4 pilus major pilin [Allopusillimonas soli]
MHDTRKAATMHSTNALICAQARVQFGFSLLEVSIATAVILLLAIIGIPAINNHVIESRVPKAGEEVARFALHARVNAAQSSTAPYRGIGTHMLAALADGSGALTVLGNGPNVRVLHGLGSDGEIRVGEHASGTGMTVTFTRVNGAACPGIASVLQRMASSITLSAAGRSHVTLKDAGVAYSAVQAAAHCAKGDANTFTFVMG